MNIEVVKIFNEWSVQTKKSSSLLATDMVISHRDLDSKKVFKNKNIDY